MWICITVTVSIFCHYVVGIDRGLHYRQRYTQSTQQLQTFNSARAVAQASTRVSEMRFRCSMNDCIVYLWFKSVLPFISTQITRFSVWNVFQEALRDDGLLFFFIIFDLLLHKLFSCDLNESLASKGQPCSSQNLTVQYKRSCLHPFFPF